MLTAPCAVLPQYKVVIFSTGCQLGTIETLHRFQLCVEKWSFFFFLIIGSYNPNTKIL